jgi:peptide/nickel transport system permease protein
MDMTSTDDYTNVTPESTGLVTIVSGIQLLLAVVMLLLGIAVLGGMVAGAIISIFGGSLVLPDILVGWPFQAFVLIILGYMGWNNGQQMKGEDPYAYSSALYMNLISAGLLLTIGFLGLLLISLPLLVVILLFTTSVRPFWYPEWREDMGPRSKELKYSLHLVRKSPLVVGGIVILVFMVSIALLAPVITPYGPEERVWADARDPPGSVSEIPKYTAERLFYQNDTDVQLLPNFTIGELRVDESHLQLTDEPPELYMSINVRDKGEDQNINVSVFIGVYDIGKDEFLAMSEAERQGHLIDSKLDNESVREAFDLTLEPITYTYVFWYNATQKTSIWQSSQILQFRYNFWYPTHMWGVDDTGGDVYSRIVWAAQVDLRISITIVLVALVTGAIIGAVAGYYGGKIDELMMRVTDIFFAFPGLILAMAIVMALGERNLDNISLALMITWWPVYARLVRGQVLSEREKLYVEAARSVGASDSRILFTHILPNTFQPLIVQATMDTGGVLLTAAGLSFIGFGPPAGVAEWGLMISNGQYYLTVAPWMSLFPGLAILVTALAFNLVGDGIRDILDPKLRRR